MDRSQGRLMRLFLNVVRAWALRDKLRFHDEAVRRGAYIFKGKTCYEGQLARRAWIQNRDILRFYDLRAFHAIDVGATRCLEGDFVVSRNIPETAKQRIAVSGDACVSQLSG